jgi:hypothetical protein
VLDVHPVSRTCDSTRTQRVSNSRSSRLHFQRWQVTTFPPSRRLVNACNIAAEPRSVLSGNSSADSLGGPSCESQWAHKSFSAITQHLPVGLDGLTTNQHNNNSCSSNSQQLPCDNQSPFELDGGNYLPSPGISFFSTTPEVVQMTTVTQIPDVDLYSLEQPLESAVPLAVLSPRSDMMWPNWPPNLPSPELLRHLCVAKAYRYSFVSKLTRLTSFRIEVFFTYQTNARRLFHVPTFMNSLTLPPSHPRFPISPVLHAICAISPMYTAAALTLASLAGQSVSKA